MLTQLHALASHQRLQIIHLLKDGPVQRANIGRMLGMTYAGAYKHLNIMESAGIIKRDGEHMVLERKYRDVIKKLEKVL